MDMKPVISSNIAAIGFDNGTLTVEFKNGGRYEYMGVDKGVYEAMQTAESIGRYFLQNIKGSYACQKVG
jgi:hypothetical protein